jgi:hypothetical protein
VDVHRRAGADVHGGLDEQAIAVDPEEGHALAVPVVDRFRVHREPPFPLR